MFETFMVHKYVKGMLIGKTYYQGDFNLLHG
jgi:hypothetical protein